MSVIPCVWIIQWHVIHDMWVKTFISLTSVRVTSNQSHIYLLWYMTCLSHAETERQDALDHTQSIPLTLQTYTLIMCRHVQFLPQKCTFSRVCCLTSNWELGPYEHNHIHCPRKSLQMKYFTHKFVHCDKFHSAI